MGALLKLVLVHSVCYAVFIFCCSSLQLIPPTTNLNGNETDRLALLAIKALIVQHDPNHPSSIMSSWNDSVHFCMWGGVTCSQRHHQRVTMLNLKSQGLAGSISPYIGNLSFLGGIYLHNNSFTHQIPPEIGHLRRLQVLRLNNNSFNGSIPASISNCRNLFFLSVGHNHLVGDIPTKLGLLSKLETFVFEANQLTGKIPPHLGNLTSLTALAGSSNNLMGSIPPSLCQLEKVSFFSLGQNMFSGTVPSCIYNLSAILIFTVAGNHLHGSIPSDFTSAFPNLQVFDISMNGFTGIIPLRVSNATNLVHFNVGDNSLTGQVPDVRELHKLELFSVAANHLGSGRQGDVTFISELVNATQLMWLEMGFNNFGGTLPSSLTNLSTNLEHVWLLNNQLHGSIPSGFGNLVNLASLDMQGNSFTGNIPNDIGKLSRLVELRLDNNKLSGNLPSSLSNLTMLTFLELQANNLSGTIPPNLGKCTSLLLLDISQNNMDGIIPQQLVTGLFSLVSINFSKNHFDGSLPLEIGNLKTLGVLDVSENMFSGQIPSSLGSCESLEILHLQGNFFEGIIPSSFRELRGLRDLDLSRNNFSEDVSQFSKLFGNLENLNLSFNDFWGELPVEGVFKNASAISVVGNNRLCGGIASLKLSLCKYRESKGEGLSRKMKLMIVLLSGVTLLGCAMLLSFLLLSKKRKAIEVMSTLGNSMLQVSYATLLKATDGFSATNLIGAGAFGSVYKGILEDDGVVVAVKVFNMSHRGASKSFVAECEALRNIKHRNLVKILTACSSIDYNGNDFKALVYEFMRNGSLEEWLHPSTGNGEVTEAPKVLSLVQRVDIAVDVASALDYLHNHCETPIVHCDLKPSNVLLDKELTGHVSDFGISRFLSAPASNIVSGNHSNSIGIRGSLGYAAPEYGMGSEVSTDGDVYSFGILLLEMFTGKRPTDHMFSDGMNLHNYVKIAIPERVAEIFDPLILSHDTLNGSEVPSQPSRRAQKMKECLTLIFGIGIACSFESPPSRKDIGDVVSELLTIRNNLLG